MLILLIIHSIIVVWMSLAELELEWHQILQIIEIVAVVLVILILIDTKRHNVLKYVTTLWLMYQGGMLILTNFFSNQQMRNYVLWYFSAIFTVTSIFGIVDLKTLTFVNLPIFSLFAIVHATIGHIKNQNINNFMPLVMILFKVIIILNVRF